MNKNESLIACPKCKTEMKKGSVMNSANTIFQEWVCPHCNNKTMKAVGMA